MSVDSLITDISLFSSDPEATTKFFGSHLGYNISQEVGYHIMNSGTKSIFILPPEKLDGEHPQKAIFFYVVKDMDSVITRFVAAGANVKAEKSTFPGVGSRALIEIPGEVVIGLWEHADPNHEDKREFARTNLDNNTSSYFEIVSKDVAATLEFLTKQCDAKLSKMEGNPDGDYYMVEGAPEQGYTYGLRSAYPDEAAPQSDAPEELMEKLAANGAKKIHETKLPVPGMGYYQFFVVPGNIMFSLWQNWPSETNGQNSDATASTSEAPAKEEKAEGAEGGVKRPLEDADQQEQPTPTKRLRDE